MSFFRFLLSEAVRILSGALLVCLWGVIAYLAGASSALIGLTALFVCSAGLIALFVRYVFVRRRIGRIERLSRQMKEVYLLGETLPRPLDAVEEEYFFLMKTLSRAAVSAVSDLTREKEEYLDYIESWVHEIKTPLTACSLLLSGGGDKSKIRAELRRADNLAESALYFARLRAAGSDIKIEKFRVAAAADEAVQSEAELLIAAGIGVETEGDFFVASDKGAVVFMLKQLLVNCAKYCRGCRVKIAAAGGVLSVEDDGAGIPAEEIPLLFSRGFVGRAGRERGGGTGMGLYLFKKVGEKAGIDVRAESKEGEGAFTRFSLIFPEAQTALEREND